MEHFLLTLQNTIKKYWDKPAASTYKGETYTYGEFATEIKKLHILFELLGVEHGDKVALCAKNTARWAITYMASNTYKSVIVPILVDFTADSLMNLINHSESKLLIINKEIWDKCDASKMPDLQLVVDIDSWSMLYYSNDKAKSAYEGYISEFNNRYSNGLKPEDLDFPVETSNEMCTLSYTSGSTGSPKGVMLTYKNFSHVVDFCRRHIPSDNSDRILSMLPMAHIYGLVIEFIYPMCNGVHVTWLGKVPTPAFLLGALADIKPYLVVTVPLVMEKIFKAKVLPKLETPLMKCLIHIPFVKSLIFNKIKLGLEKAFGGNVREFIFGGAALNPDVDKWLHKIKLPYTVGYGMTEAAPLIAYSNHKQFVPASCGRAIDWDTVRIDSPDPKNIVGEIQVKGPNVCIGYYKNAEATEQLYTKDGFLKTGDLGIIDAKGNIFIKGRSKNMILGSSGQNIYPEEMEAVINNQDFVLESLVLERDKKLVALVFVDENASEANPELKAITDVAEHIKNSSNANLPMYCQLARVELVEKPFEKTPKMSIKRFLYN